MNDKVAPGGSIGFGSLIALLFIGLKLGNVITWSWLWVLSPLWIPFAAIVVVILIAFAFGTCVGILDALKRGRPR